MSSPLKGILLTLAGLGLLASGLAAANGKFFDNAVKCDFNQDGKIDDYEQKKCSGGGSEGGDRAAECWKKAEARIQEFYAKYGSNTSAWSEEILQAYLKLKEELEGFVKQCSKTKEIPLGEVCKAFRLIDAFLAEHGSNVSAWDEETRNAYLLLKKKVNASCSDVAPPPGDVEACRKKVLSRIAEFLSKHGSNVTQWSDDVLDAYVHLKKEVNHELARCEHREGGPFPPPPCQERKGEPQGPPPSEKKGKHEGRSHENPEKKQRDEPRDSSSHEEKKRHASCPPPHHGDKKGDEARIQPHPGDEKRDEARIQPVPSEQGQDDAHVTDA